jgi:multiple sugar transport system substrate-binding protein
MKKVATLLLAATLSLASAQTTITYGTWDATREKADKKVIAAFEAANPGIKVKYNLVPWDTYWQKAAAMTAGGVTFDVMWMNLDNLPFYASQGALEQIAITAQEKARFPAASIGPYMLKDGVQTYGFPLGPQAVSVFVNRQLFKERGIAVPTTAWTWDEVIVAAKKLTFSKGGKKYWGINGQDLQIDLEYGMSFYYTNGGTGIIKKEGSGYVPNLDASFATTAQQLYDLVYKHKVAPTPKDTAQAGYQLFQAGQLGIYVEGTWMTAVFAETPKLDWAFAPFPTLKKGETPKPVFSAHALVVPKSAKQKEVAVNFAKWVTTAQQPSRLLAENGLFPTQVDPYKSLYFQSLPGRNGQTIVEQLKSSVVINSDLHYVSNLPEVLGALNTALNLAWTGNTTLDKAIAQAKAEMGKLLKDAKELNY